MNKKLVFGLLMFSLVAPISASAYKIGIVTDIHAGRNFVRDYRKQARNNILYPKRYQVTLKNVLEKMKAQGVQTVVYNGDNTNKDTPNYARAVIKLANTSGIESLWVRGNHDLRRTSRLYFSTIGRTYHYVDRGGWRIIILDTNFVKPNSWGGIADSQVDWLRSSINDASGSVVVFMHHPIFMVKNNRPDDIFPGYKYLESVLSESGKVKYVVSGHIHVPTQFSKEYNGVQYLINVPLSLKGQMNSYQILDLPEEE